MHVKLKLSNIRTCLMQLVMFKCYMLHATSLGRTYAERARWIIRGHQIKFICTTFVPKIKQAELSTFIVNR